MSLYLVGRLLSKQGNLKDKELDAHLEELDDKALNAMIEEFESYNELEDSEAQIIILEHDLERNQEMSNVLQIRRLPCSSHKVS